MKKPSTVETRHVWRGTPIGPKGKLPSKAWMYHAICHFALQISWNRTSLLKREQMKWRYHVLYLGYPEEILIVKIILFPILEILFSTILGTLGFLGIVAEIFRSKEIWYWIVGFKMPDRTRYSLTYIQTDTGWRIEKTIDPDDLKKLQRKEQRQEKIKQQREQWSLKKIQRKEKRLSKRAL